MSRVVSFLVCALLFSVAAGCWRSSEPPVEEPVPINNTALEDDASQPSVAASPPPPKQLPLAPGHKKRRFDKSLRDELQLLDAGEDDWLSEAFAQQVQPQLRRLGELIRTPADEKDEIYATLADETFRCRDLRPKCEEVYGDRLLSVRRSEPGLPWAQGSHRRSKGLAAALRQFRRPLDEAADVRAELEMVSVHLTAGTAETKLMLQASGQTKGGTLQINSTWLCAWNTYDEPPSLKSIEVKRYEQIASRSPDGKMFADCTYAVAGQTPAWNEQLAWSVDFWRSQAERTLVPQVTGIAGLAIGDVNGDELEDVYLCYGNGLPNRLLVQKVDGTVNEAASQAGVDWLDACTSALLIDLDNDGDQDLVVGVDRAVLVHENDGTGKFKLRTVVTTSSLTMSMAAADYNEDQLLDLYVCGHTPAGEEHEASLFGFPLPLHDAANGGRNLLLRNEGEWKFSDATEEAGMDENNSRFSYACAWEDFDNDGDQDLYVANDFAPNNLYENEYGTFRDVAEEAGVNGASGRSISWTDYNGDGRMDLFVGGTYSAAGHRVTSQRRIRFNKTEQTVNQLRRLADGNSIFANSDYAGFRDMSMSAHVQRGGWAWASKFVDLNNDGRDDVVVANGLVTGSRKDDLDSFFWRRVAAQSPVGKIARSEAEDYSRSWRAMSHLVRTGSSWGGGQRNSCFLNLPREPLADVSGLSGLDHPDDARALAVADWDHDGDLDLWITGRGAPRVRFLRNNTQGRWVALRLQGASCNRDAIGARLELKLKGGSGKLVRTVRAGDAFASQSSKWVHFGLGKKDEIAELSVRWPDGKEETFTDLEASQRYRIVQGTSQCETVTARKPVDLAEGSPPLPVSDGAGRILALSRPPFPTLKYRNFQEIVDDVGGPSEKKLLVVLWASWNPASEQQLKHLSSRSFELRLANVEVVGLAVDELPLGDLYSPAAAALVERLNVQFPVGTANDGIVAQLDALQRVLLDTESPLPVPCSFLLDKHGRVGVIYRGRVGIEQLKKDAELIDTEDVEKLLPHALALSGRWWQTPGLTNAFEVARMLSEDERDEEATAYARQLITIGHQRGPGYERLLPQQLYFFLGTLLEEKQLYEDAQKSYEIVLQVDPKHREAHRRMAYIARKNGDAEKAADYMRRLVREDPENAQLRGEWAMRLTEAGRVREALIQYRQLLASYPDWITPANNLAWLMSTHPDTRLRNTSEAIRLARRNCEATNYGDPRLLDTLAAAFAAAGRFDGAVATVGQAIRLAEDQELSAERVAGMQLRLEYYQAGQPYVEDPRIEAPEPSEESSS